MRITLVLLLACLAPRAEAGEPPALPQAHARDIAALLDGVKTIGVPGVPGTISVFGPDAFPVVLAEAGGQPVPVVAATRIGRGRVVVFAHNGYFGDLFETADTGRLLLNACRWVTARKGRVKGLRVGVRGRAALHPHLRKAGLQVAALDDAKWARRLREIDVLCVPVADLSRRDLKALRGWLERGGGLLCGLPGWGWKQLNPGKDLATENTGNRLLAPVGLVWDDGLIKSPARRRLAVAGAPASLTHAGIALDALVSHTEGRHRLGKRDSALAVATVTRAVRSLPPGDELLHPRLNALLMGARGGRTVPTAKQPFDADTGLAKLLLAAQILRDRRREAGAIRAHPAASAFPGAVPADAPRATRRLVVDTAVPGWHSTGLYAAPGEIVKLRVTSSRKPGAGWKLRIGAHKDRLWSKAAWRRAPDITRTFDIAGNAVRAASAFGGLLYVVVPPRGTSGRVEVEISGAVEAPYFVRGQTDLGAWRSAIRARPAPWAELATSKVILTVPSRVIRDLDDPETLMAWWDRVLDACADLAALPRERTRPERFVTDEQISAGYMHAGYPIMTHLDAATRFVDLSTLSSKGDWGMFHELGHNHQHKDWTFGGTVEVTCNLFSLYLMETVCKKGIGHRAMAPEKVAENRAKYRKAGARFEHWKAKPFTALIAYHEMRAAFGWEAYKRVFAEYRGLSVSERPKTDAQKRDQWLVRFSKTVGRNLGPYFESWGIPTSKAARAEAAGLPQWTP